jgi:hypothetical protein
LSFKTIIIFIIRHRARGGGALRISGGWLRDRRVTANVTAAVDVARGSDPRDDPRRHGACA